MVLEVHCSTVSAFVALRPVHASYFGTPVLRKNKIVCGHETCSCIYHDAAIYYYTKRSNN